MEILHSAFGVFVLVALCWAFGRKRKAIDWRLVGGGIGLQLVFGLLLLGAICERCGGMGIARIRAPY